MVTMGTALAAVRTRLDESTATSWTDPEIRAWINEGVADIARRTESIQKSATISVVAGQQEYSDLPTNLLRLNRVEFISAGASGQVSHLELRELNALDSTWYGGKQTSSGRPIYCGLSGYPPYLQLTLYPIPAESGATIKVYYYASPAALPVDGSGDGFALDLPTGWDDLVYEYATYLAQRRDATPSWQDTKRIYEEHLGDMLAMTERWHDQPGFISNDAFDDGFGYGGW